MEPEWLKANWALAAALPLAALLLTLLLVQAWRGSVPGRLRRLARRVVRERSRCRRAEATVRRAERRLSRLRERGEMTRPRHLREAGEALADARALADIARDRVMIAENHLRRLILEEYPPARQERLRTRYRLTGVLAEGRPFTF